MSFCVLINGLLLCTETEQGDSHPKTTKHPKTKAHLPLQHIVALINSFRVRKGVLFKVQVSSLIRPAPSEQHTQHNKHKKHENSFDLSWGSVRNGLTVREFLFKHFSINVDNTQHLQQSLVMTDVRRHTRLTADDDVNLLRGNTRLVVMLEKANW